MEKRALDRLDGLVGDAIDLLAWGVKQRGKNQWFAYNCACTILKKVVPDKKSYTKKDEGGPKNQIINNAGWFIAGVCAGVSIMSVVLVSVTAKNL